MQAESHINISKELQRKLIHISWIIIPIFYSVVDQEIMLATLIPITVIFLSIEILRKQDGKFKELFLKYFGSILREHERNSGKLTGASYVLIASCISIALFPKLVAIVALSVLAISDTAASLVGKKYGKVKMKFSSKTLEGTIAFILSGIFVVFFIGFSAQQNLLFHMSGFIGVCIATVFEAVSSLIKIDDNLLIPLSIGLFMSILL